MQVTETMTEGQALEFNMLYANLFLIETAATYFEAVETIFHLRGNKYATNKIKEAETACNKVVDCIKRELTHGMEPQQKEIALQAVEHHKELIHEMFALEVDEQARVRNLIKKIKSERR